MSEHFMLDLSVPWNTSDPSFKKLSGGPQALGETCAMTNNNEDLFAMWEGSAYIYNVKSDTWRLFHNANFATTDSYARAVSDPETGIIYLPDSGVDLSGGRRVMLTVDPRAMTVKSTAFNSLAAFKPVVVWSTILKSLIASNATHDPVLFTPSKVTESSDGWSVLSTTGKTSKDNLWNCGAAAYDGSKIVFLGSIYSVNYTTVSVYTLDVATGIWKQGPAAPKGFTTENCAVSGDQFITWGYMEPMTETTKSTTLVFNMKTEKWVSGYTPPPRPTTTTTISQPSQTLIQDTPDSELSGMSSSHKSLVIIIVAVAGILLAIILGLVFRYRRRTRQSDPNGPSIDSLGTKDDINASGKEELSNSDRARLHRDFSGAQLVSERPNVIMDDPTTRRGVQGGAK